MNESAAASNPAVESPGDAAPKTPLWRIALIAAGVLVMLFLVVAYLLPDSYRIERSIVIDAPPEAIHAYVGHLKRWPEWTVWNTENYPNLRYEYEGPESGVGARQIWNDPDTGSGHLEVTQSDPREGIVYTMTFEGFEPLDGSILYDVQETGTEVTWLGEGNLGSNPIGRYFGLMMESMIGADFEQGLSNLKSEMEAAGSAEQPDAEQETAKPDASAGAA